MKNRKTYYQVASLVFLIVAVLHALRLIYGWSAEIAGVTIPLWVSGAAVIIAGYLSYRGFTWKQLKG